MFTVDDVDFDMAHRIYLRDKNITHEEFLAILQREFNLTFETYDIETLSEMYKELLKINTTHRECIQMSEYLIILKDDIKKYKVHFRKEIERIAKLKEEGLMQAPRDITKNDVIGCLNLYNSLLDIYIDVWTKHSVICKKIMPFITNSFRYYEEIEAIASISTLEAKSPLLRKQKQIADIIERLQSI